jgi:hypothetical protein
LNDDIIWLPGTEVNDYDDKCYLMFKRQTVSTMFTWFLGRPFFDKYMLVLDYTNENSDYVNIGIGVLND